jgi:DNA-binding IclR family transcriptional regulator
MTSKASASEHEFSEAEGAGGDRLFVAALERGLRVLECFGADGGAWNALGIREIASRTGLSVPAVQRATHTLVRLGYLSKDPATGRVRLTPRVLGPAYAYLQASPLYEVALPVVIDMRDEIGETVNLSVLDGFHAVILLRMPSRRRINPTSTIGRRMPAFCTATGRSILAFASPAEQDVALDAAHIQALTPRTVTSRSDLLRCLEAVRADGYALVEQEASPAELAIAAPILDRQNLPLAALGISVSAADWTATQMRKRLAPAVVRAAAAISQAVKGWNSG